MGSKLLAVYDQSGRLWLPARSPAGGQMPTIYRCGCGHWGHLGCRHDEKHPYPYALVLRADDGTPDPLGMIRALLTLARIADPAGGGGEGGAYLHREGWFWHLYVASDAAPLRAYRWPVQDDGERAPEAVARLLAELAGCEVIRG